MSAPSHSATRPSHPNTIRLECAQRSHQGGRSQNEDSVAWNEIDDGILAIIADGMGGGIDGKRFSSDAVAKVQATIISARAGVGAAQLEAALKAAAAELSALRSSDPRYHASGTTLVLAGVMPADGGAVVTVLHVGDSRAYMIRASGQVELLTHDHTYAEQLIRQGASPEEAHSHPQAPRLTHALGDSLDLSLLPDFQRTTRLASGDSLLLCTDGVSKLLTDEQIAAEVAGRPAQDAVARVVNLALRSGASDNVTALAVRCLPAAPARKLPLGLVLLAIVAVIAIALGVMALLGVVRSNAAPLPSPGPTITPLAEETRQPGLITSTPKLGETSTPAPSVLPTDTPTNTPTPTPTPTVAPSRIPRPSTTADAATPSAMPSTNETATQMATETATQIATETATQMATQMVIQLATQAATQVATPLP
jgi:serine/threonine protein phosphatase PrpC